MIDAPANDVPEAIDFLRNQKSDFVIGLQFLSAIPFYHFQGNFLHYLRMKRTPLDAKQTFRLIWHKPLLYPLRGKLSQFLGTFVSALILPSRIQAFAIFLQGMVIQPLRLLKDYPGFLKTLALVFPYRNPVQLLRNVTPLVPFFYFDRNIPHFSQKFSHWLDGKIARTDRDIALSLNRFVQEASRDAVNWLNPKFYLRLTQSIKGSRVSFLSDIITSVLFGVATNPIYYLASQYVRQFLLPTEQRLPIHQLAKTLYNAHGAKIFFNGVYLNIISFLHLPSTILLNNIIYLVERKCYDKIEKENQDQENRQRAQFDEDH